MKSIVIEIKADNGLYCGGYTIFPPIGIVEMAEVYSNDGSGNGDFLFEAKTIDECIDWVCNKLKEK